MPLPPGPIGLVHEWFTPRSVGGAELVVRELDALLDRPQLHALVDGESRRSGSWLQDRSIRTSFIQRLPFGVSHVQQFLPLLPLAIEQIDLSPFPLVISSSHLVAKGVLTSPDQCHLSYVHTPVRYAWDQMHAYLRHSALAQRGFGPLIRWQLHRLRQWDQLSGQRPDRLIANSRFTAARIGRTWGRAATVVHPPVAVERFRWDQPRDDVYLCLCRLVPYKRVDLVVEAFNRARLPLVVIGDGPERARLETLAGPTVRLLGRLGESEVNGWLERCRAYVYAGLEDFGIAPVEAMAAGAPVIGLGQGGLLDTVRCLNGGGTNPTGLLFPQQSVRCLQAALEAFEADQLWRRLPPETLRNWAEQFRPELFRRRMAAVIEQTWQQHRRGLEHRSCALPMPLPMAPPLEEAMGMAMAYKAAAAAVPLG